MQIKIVDLVGFVPVPLCHCWLLGMSCCWVLFHAHAPSTDSLILLILIRISNWCWNKRRRSSFMCNFNRMKIKAKWSWLVRFAENEIPMSATWYKWKPYTESEWFNELRVALDLWSWMKKRDRNGMKERKREMVQRMHTSISVEEK